MFMFKNFVNTIMQSVHYWVWTFIDYKIKRKQWYLLLERVLKINNINILEIFMKLKKITFVVPTYKEKLLILF